MIRKETDRARCTHCLETADGGTCQGMERNRPSEAHSLSGDDRGRNLSEHGKKLTERGALTSWRRQREGFIRTQKETERARHTHKLKTAQGETCQDMERNRPSKVHSQTGDGRWRNSSGRGNRPTKRGTLTSWRRQRARFVKAQKETDRARRTHKLETAEEGTCQDTERIRASEAHSLSGDDRGMNSSGHGKKLTEQGTLTPWRW